MAGRSYIQEAIGRTGLAFLTLHNSVDGTVIVGNIEKMRPTKNALKLSWKLPKASHTSEFDKAVISTDRVVLWSGQIDPIRLDNGTKYLKFEF